MDIETGEPIDVTFTKPKDTFNVKWPIDEGKMEMLEKRFVKPLRPSKCVGGIPREHTQSIIETVRAVKKHTH